MRLAGATREKIAKILNEVASGNLRDMDAALQAIEASFKSGLKSSNIDYDLYTVRMDK